MILETGNLKPLDLEISFDMLRFLSDPQSLEAKAHLEELLKCIEESAKDTFFAGLKASLLDQRNKVRMKDFITGMVVGTALAAASADRTEGSPADFLKKWEGQRGNVTDIADAFRKRQRT